MCPTQLFVRESCTSDPYLSQLCQVFPSFQYFYDDDEEIMRDTANSLAMMEHLIEGTRRDYQELIQNQKEDTIKLKTFIALSNFFYSCRVKKVYRHRLENFIYLDGISRTKKAHEITRFLPSTCRNPKTQEALAISLVDYYGIPEIKLLGSDHDRMAIQNAFNYRLKTIEADRKGEKFSTAELGDEILRLAQLTAVCEIAGKCNGKNAFGTSTALTESMANKLLELLIDRYQTQATAKLFSLAEA